MTSKTHSWTAVKPAVSASVLHKPPYSPCELLPAGLPGLLEINGTLYVVTIIGYLPAEGEPIVDGFRLTKDNGEAHDICLVSGRLECSCGDWIFRRSAQVGRELMDCKHCLACMKHFLPPEDQRPVLHHAVAVLEEW
jgi:hypothetical protein